MDEQMKQSFLLALNGLRSFATVLEDPIADTVSHSPILQAWNYRLLKFLGLEDMANSGEKKYGGCSLAELEKYIYGGDYYDEHSEYTPQWMLDKDYQHYSLK